MSGVKRFRALGPMIEPDDLRAGSYVLADDYDKLAAELATVKKVAYGNLELMEERYQLAADNNRLREALIKAEAMISELDYVGEMTELGKAHLVEMRAALSTANGEQLASASEEE